MTWYDAVDRFLSHQADRERSRHTIAAYRSDLAQFAAWFATSYRMEPDLESLGSSVIRAWKAQLGVVHPAPATVNRKLAAIGSFAKWCAGSGLAPLPEMPRQVRQATRPPRWLTRREELALVRAVERSGHLRGAAVVIVLLHTGLRIEELASLTWRAVELSPRKGSVTIIGKGRKQRRVDLNAEARKALLGLGKAKDGAVFKGQRGPLTVEGLAAILEGYGAAAKLEGFSAHVLRHTFCRRLWERGVPIEVIAAIAGHESLETTRRYVEPGREDLRAAVEKLAGPEDDE